jgi:hypothetical protein
MAPTLGRAGGPIMAHQLPVPHELGIGRFDLPLAKKPSMNNTLSPDSLKGDFEDISLRDAVNASTSSPTNSFSDSSSTRSSSSSRDSSSSVTSTPDSDDYEPKTPVSSQQQSPPVQQTQPAQLTSNYVLTSLKSTPPLKSKSSHSILPREPARTNLNAQTRPQMSMLSNRSMSEDYNFVHQRLARQRSMGALPRLGTRDIQMTSINPLANNRRASTGTPSGQASRMANPAPSKRHSNKAPLLRKALSTNQLTKGLGIYADAAAATAAAKQVKSAPNLVSTYKPKLRPVKRLSSDELELKYDHEQGDDDLPETACMWNVPLSPALYAKSRTASLDMTSVGYDKGSQPISSVAPRKRERSSALVSPDINTLPAIKESEAAGHIAGLEDLGEDAKDLTLAFQQLPTAYDEKHQSVSSSSSGSRRSSQQPDIPQGLSADQPACPVSSMTRPSYLPPKSENEEKKHLREYTKILEQAALADKRKEAKRKSDIKEREKQRQKDENEWKTRILPNFDKAIKEASTRELWWRGVPPKYKEQVWKQMIGNRLRISADTYKACLDRVNQCRHQEQHRRMFAQIDQDCSQTFPEVQIFGNRGPLHDDLVEVVSAYAVFRPNVGYKIGINTMAAVLLLNMSALHAFTCLANMLDGSLSMALMTRDDRTVTSYYTSFLKVFNTKLPSLYKHFQDLRLPPAAYLEPMMTAQFTQHMPLDIVSRIWDVLVFEGDGFLLRVALGLIRTIEHRLYCNENEVLGQLGWSSGIIDVGDEDAFMRAVRDALKANIIM